MATASLSGPVRQTGSVARSKTTDGKDVAMTRSIGKFCGDIKDTV